MILHTLGMKLSKEQEAMIFSDTGWKRLIAGPGSGKTTVIIHRILNLIEMGMDPGRILAITFTRKAAGEMLTRLQHSLFSANKNRQGILRLNYSERGKTTPWIGTFHSLAFGILKNQSGIRTKKILSEKESKSLKLEIGLGFRGRSKNIPLSGWIFKSESSHPLPDRDLRSDFQEALKREKKKRGLLEFGDFIPMVIDQWDLDPGKCIEFQEKYDAILVDEFQDTDPVQVDFLRRIVRKGSEFCAVGDDWQAIYGFRGGFVKSLLNFDDYFPNSKKYSLKKNYRSAPSIVNFSNKLLALNKEKINKKMDSGDRPGFEPGFLFFRTRGELGRWFEKNLLMTELGKIYGGNLFKNKSIAILVRENQYILGLESLVSRYGNIQVLTIHKSKGLEFDIVVLAGIEEGIFPSRDNDIEEERRLLFVAATRARELLLFCIIPGNGHPERGFWRELGIGFLRRRENS